MWFQHLLLFEMKATVKQWCLSLSDFLVMWMASGLSHYRIQAKKHLCWQSAFYLKEWDRIASDIKDVEWDEFVEFQGTAVDDKGVFEFFLSFPGLQVVLLQLCMIVPDIILGLFVFVTAWVTWPQMCDGIGNSKCRVCAGRMHLCCIPFGWLW